MNVTGYADTENGVLYCPSCTIEGNRLNPIYDTDEWDYVPCCDNCHETIEVCIINYDEFKKQKEEIIIQKINYTYNFNLTKHNYRGFTGYINKKCPCCNSGLDILYSYIIGKLKESNLLIDDHKELCCNCRILYKFCKSLKCSKCKGNLKLKKVRTNSSGVIIGIIVKCNKCYHVKFISHSECISH